METFMGVAIGAVILIGIVWYFFFWKTPEVVTNSPATSGVVEDSVVTRNESYEAIRDGDNLDDQLRVLSQLSTWPKDAATPVKLDTLGKRLELAETILEHEELTEAARVSAARAAISAVEQIYFFSLDEGIDTDGQIKSNYVRITSNHLNDKDNLVAREAKLSEVKLLVFDNINKDLRGSFDLIQREILSLIDKNPNDPFVTSMVTNLAERVNQDDETLGNRLFSSILAAYKNLPSIDDKILPRLKTIEDKIAVRESELGVLTPEVAHSDQFDAYFEKLVPLIDRPDTGLNFVNKLYTIVNYLEEIGEYEKAVRVLERMGASVAKRTDPNAQVHAARMSRFGMIRNATVGKVLDLNDTDSSGSPIDVSQLKNRPVIIVYYSPNNQRSANLLNDLHDTYTLIANTGVKVIAIAVESRKSGTVESIFHPDWFRIESIPPAGPTDSDDKLSAIFKRLPVTKVPYFALVDGEGIVRHLNVPIDQLKTRLEAMVSSAR